jgi:hypothetical protein
MPPNSLADKPICVSDSFHFSSFYWRESSASLAGLNNDDGDDDSMAGARIRGRSSTVGSESETDQTVLKVCLCCTVCDVQ